MSFSSDVKLEMTAVVPDKPCCRAAMAYGLLECGHSFTPAEVSLQTEQAAIADLYSELTATVCGVPSPARSTLRRRTALQVCTYDEAAHRQQVLARFGHGDREISLRLNRANIDCEQCAKAYLRGAFLACGAVTDPEHDYHLEFSVPHYNLSRDLLALLREVEFPAKAVSRGGSYIVYLKESERIEDCLTYLGAPRGALELMNVKIVKSIRNDTNRRINCENANIDKTVAAAAVQRDALHRIEKNGGIAALPEDLQALARLRLDNPDMSLRDLGAAMEPPLSRSGVNHRLQRILKFAETLEE
ncbi:MAG: DNA-binding protein WhiA [Clostridia bacterium]|nr:DNA-binding protein WhiA [Clostridia bacterium]